jgi:fructokinase
MIHIGLDLGGTKISAIALDAAGKELGRTRLPTPKDYPSILAQCAAFVRGFEKETGVKGTVGVGSPGAIDTREGLIRFSPNIEALRGKYLARDLAKDLGVPVKLANDAACFALSESRDGAAAGLNRIYGIILGTGVGGAPVERAQFMSGPNTYNEWGHVSLPWMDDGDLPKPACGCGRVGCIEAYLSGPALHRQLAAALGHECSNDELNAGLQKRDEKIMRVMDVYMNRLGKACAMLVTIMDPDAIVLGGGVSNLDILYAELPARIGQYTPVTENKTKVLKAKFGDDSGLRGAAWLGATQ